MRKLFLFLALVLFSSIFVGSAFSYTIEGNSVFIEDAQASLRVTPHTAQFPSAEGYRQEFEVCNKTGVTTNLFGAYVFERDLFYGKAEYLVSEDYEWVEHEKNCFYEFEYETNVNTTPNVHQGECFYTNLQQEKITVFDIAFRTGNVGTGTVQYDVNELVKNWSNVTNSFEEKIIENRFAYTYTLGKEVLGNSCETWRITYKPSEVDETEKWDLWLWAGENWDCILDDTCLKELRLDPWWSGDGSVGDPFIVTDCNQMQTIDSYTIPIGGPTEAEAKNQYWELGNNLDCSGFGNFDPIGNDVNVFYGHFDGKFFTISNITINEDEVGNGGLFAHIYTDGSVENVGLIDFNSWNTNWFSMPVFGQCVGGLISEVFVDGAIVAGAGGYYVSGFGGAMSATCKVQNSYVANTTVTARGGTQRVAGFMSYTANDANLFNNYSAAIVTAGVGADSGAFLGLQAAGTCTQNFWDSDIVIEGAEGCATGSTGKTTAQLFQEATFTNWDFENIWLIVEDVSYPTFISSALPPYTGTIDLNITTINGLDFKTNPVFVFGLDENITIDFNVYSKDNNRLSIDLNNSVSEIQGSGTIIVKDLNLTAAYCPDQNFATVSECSYSWNYLDILDGNYIITGLLIDTEGVTDFNASDGNFIIANDVNLLIKVPIDEETFELIDTNVYLFRVTYSDGNNAFSFEDLNAPLNLSIPFGTLLTFTIDENTSNYYSRSYYLNFQTATATATLQPYLIKKATAGGGGIQSVLFTKTENNKAVPDIEIRAYRIVPVTGKTLMEQIVTDSAGSATFSFVQGKFYTIDFLRDGNIFSGDLVLQPVFSSYQFYLSAKIFSVSDENALIFDVNYSPSVDYIDSNAWADINISINVENATISDLNILIYLDNNTLYNVVVFVDGFYNLPPVSIVGATSILNVEVILTTTDGLRLSRSKAYSYNLSIPQKGLNEFFEAIPGLVNFNRHSEHLEISTLGCLILVLFICGAIKTKSQIDTGGTALFAMLLLGVFTYMGLVYVSAFFVASIICFALIIFTRAF